MSTFFYISWFGISIISYDVKGHLKNKNIVNNNTILIQFFSYVYITYWDLTIFRYLFLYRRYLFNLCLFRDFLFNMCLFKGFLLYLSSLGAMDLSILDKSIILMTSSRVLSFLCTLIFQGVTFFEPTGLPHFRCILDSFYNYPTWTSICIRVFAVRICDFITFFISMNASGNWFARFFKWMIIWNSSLHLFIRGSRWDIVDAFQIISCRSSRISFFPPNARIHSH